MAENPPLSATLTEIGEFRYVNCDSERVGRLSGFKNKSISSDVGVIVVG